MKGCSKDIGHLLKQLDTRAAREAGWTVEFLQGSHHYRIKRHGVYVTTLPGTGGRGRGLTNSLADLKRAGFRLAR